MAEYERDPLTGDLIPKHCVNGQDQPQSPAKGLSGDDLAKLGAMSHKQLVALIRTISGAMWGIGMQTQAERDEAILLKLSILALTSTEAKDVVSTAKEYFDRIRGKAAISITQNSTVAMLVASVQPDVELLRRIKQELLDGTITLDN
jgi:hypothetical protein